MNDTDDSLALPAAAPAPDAATRKALRAQAHPLKPVVMIGDAGLTPAVLAEIDRALASHQLIKVRVLGDDRPVREALLAEIAGRTGSAPVQHIGKLLVFWRPAPALEKPQPSPTGRERPRGPYQPKKAAAAGKPSAARPVRAGSAGGRAKQKAAGSTATRPLARGAGLGSNADRSAASKAGPGRRAAAGSSAGKAGAARSTAAGRGPIGAGRGPVSSAAGPKPSRIRRSDGPAMTDQRPRRPGRSPALPSPAVKPGRGGPRR